MDEGEREVDRFNESLRAKNLDRMEEGETRCRFCGAWLDEDGFKKPGQKMGCGCCEGM